MLTSQVQASNIDLKDSPLIIQLQQSFNANQKSEPHFLEAEQNVELHQWLAQDDIQNKALASQFSELQILKEEKNQHRIQHIILVLKQNRYQTQQWVDLSQIEHLLSDLLYRHFPEDILSVIQQETPRFIGNRIRLCDFIDTWVITEYSLLLRIKKFSQRVDLYEKNLLDIRKKLQAQRKAENLNEFGIDTDSLVMVNVLEAFGMPKGRYSVTVQVADKIFETAISEVGTNPVWQLQFKFPVWSPHSHVIIHLLQHYPPYPPHEMGSLQLPLNNFKDQIPYKDDYVLEEKSGVLGDTKRRLKLQIQWTHNQHALLEDEIVRSNAGRKDIDLIKLRRDQMQKQLNVMYETFHESKLKLTVDGVANKVNEPNAFEKFFLDHSHYITSCLRFQDDARRSWQELVFLSSLVITIVNLFVLFSRPIFVKFTLIQIIGMLIWAHRDQYHHTSKFIRQLCVAIIISVISDCFWLRHNSQWQGGQNADDNFDKQEVGDNWVNFVGQAGTVLGIFLDSVFTLFTYILSLKYEYQGS